MVYGTSAMFAPHLNETEASEARNREMVALGLYSVSAFGSAQPVALAYAVKELPELFSLAPVRRLLAKAFGALFHRGIATRATIEERLGMDLPVSADEAEEMMKEIRRFKWLEAERAGRDIWVERNPYDPDRPAVREWFRLHFGGWALSRH